MEHSSNQSEYLENEHVIDITRGNNTSSSIFPDDNHNGLRELENGGVSNTALTQQPPFYVSNARNVVSATREDDNDHRHRRPLGSKLWISIDLFVTFGQILAAAIVLPLSRHERSKTPLLLWILCYTGGCIATLPYLYWRYKHPSNQGIVAGRPGSSTSTIVTINTQIPTGQGHHSITTRSWTGQGLVTASPRFNELVDKFKVALDCFFAVWFVVGNVWIFGGRSSINDAPNLYRLCVAFLLISCIGYSMPFIMCATICCCLPCIISILGLRDDIQNRGATPAFINTLPTHKFKSRRSLNTESEANTEGEGDDGVLSAGTDKERVISADDAVCCICLGRYIDNDNVGELPCGHIFHFECMDKWLKINASCPLCKLEVGEV